jgi:hypothetical protein
MNAKAIIGIIVGVILLNSSYFTIMPLPGLLTVAAIVAASALLLMDGAKGGILGKADLAFGIIIGVYALQAVLGYVGIVIPFISFIYSFQSLAFLIGGVLLIINPFANF